MFRSLFTTNISSIICAEGGYNKMYKFGELFKTLNMGHLSNKKGTFYDHNYRIHRDMYYIDLPIHCLNIENHKKEDPRFPFLLFPLFKVVDQKGMKIPYSFFRSNVRNRILTWKNEKKESICSLGTEPFFESNKTEVVLTVGNRISMNISHKKSNFRNGYFVFKDMFSDQAMVYYGVFVPSEGNFLKTELGKIYEHYIKKQPTDDEDIMEGKVSIKLFLDINMFRQKKYVEVEMQSTENVKFALQLSLPNDIQSSSSKLIINLSGRKMDNGKVYFERENFYNSKKISDLEFKLSGIDRDSSLYYKDYKKEMAEKSSRIYR